MSASELGDYERIYPTLAYVVSMQSSGSVHASHSYTGMTVFRETLASHFKEGYERSNPYEICKSKL